MSLYRWLPQASVDDSKLHDQGMVKTMSTGSGERVLPSAPVFFMSIRASRHVDGRRGASPESSLLVAGDDALQHSHSGICKASQLTHNIAVFALAKLCSSMHLKGMES